jgi:hypothetical protein
MTHPEMKLLEERGAKFRQLNERRIQINILLEKITAHDPTGPHGQGPFTGDTRESRLIDTLSIDFSPTFGGSPAVSQYLLGLNIRASVFGNFLEQQLRAELAKVEQAMLEI